ncbi:hypothetical protein TraAM80_10027 [Trypanosoma rangeli]|uniref:Uncharacterized protein n=1 Tax=Trypanosoma rangeli TaxID=5698 RepID=A0A422MS05_TRYRA|nr:uncharacterized protein TraAM80_10027 [Trypanosoma rangeli]RNE95989.1 hypothetical protein TraAM80_10027 [Trypanosoma rangeli]|eukprot:RNE95989.1 hypothetical protein TraAM80_10027 [Trypanosoma rangeli]
MLAPWPAFLCVPPSPSFLFLLAAPPRPALGCACARACCGDLSDYAWPCAVGARPLCVLCCAGAGVGVGAWGGGYCTESGLKDLRVVAEDMADAEIRAKYSSRKAGFVKGRGRARRKGKRRRTREMGTGRAVRKIRMQMKVVF